MSGNKFMQVVLQCITDVVENSNHLFGCYFFYTYICNVIKTKDMNNNYKYVTKNPFMNKLFSVEDKKLIKLADGSYYDIIRNWVYIETQDLNKNGATYDITMYRPWDLDIEHPVNNIK